MRRVNKQLIMALCVTLDLPAFASGRVKKIEHEAEFNYYGLAVA